ncbi:Spermidine/putrescine import ABC transporter ATP-binding protein PotA (TC 3.A.1.11.1) [hydrothermal vent metagenome]|uniref:Spermidine/putrescine import ABC transporter ATP-binding protein PotA (TC 3.A.1.11.1) n=1 Tax=hydrothermal vent metagenome TaxID=652676 RepID=A0A3B0T4E7_9ZZZZ
MRGMDIELKGVSIRFGTFTAVHPTDLKINAGEFFSILGPSGCGKTTILRMVSGFLNPTSGDILIGGKSMMGIGPDKRPTALIFQSLALFPLMTVRENVAFGLEMAGMSKTARRDKAAELLDLVALGDQGDKVPDELSGGQRQRVAIARALAVEPAVLLLDEPLSALDLKLRQHMRSELRGIQRKTGVTFIYITHDQGEALTMSDRIAVMKAGIIEQVDTTDQVYNAPATAFTATFVGANNIFAGKIVELAGDIAVIDTKYGRLRGRNPQGLGVGSEAILFVRPEKSHVQSARKKSDNALEANYKRRDLEGPFVNLHFERDGDTFSVHQTNVDIKAYAPGQTCTIGFDAQAGMILPAGELADE